MEKTHRATTGPESLAWPAAASRPGATAGYLGQSTHPATIGKEDRPGFPETHEYEYREPTPPTSE